MAENHSSRAPKEEDREIEEQQGEGEEEEEKPLSELQNCFSSNLHDRSSVEVEFRDQNSQSETTLTVPLLIPSSENDHEPDWPSLESKGQFGMLHQEILASVKSLASQDQAEKLVQDKSVCTPEVDQQNLSDLETKPVHAIVKKTSTDGYNWRKYGQKLVKGSENSRSYYRCTHVNCYAKKKVEHCDRSGCVIEILYKGRHNHEPPQKIKCPKARRFVSSVEPDGGSGTKECPRKLSDSDPVTCKKEPRHTTLEKELYSPSECDKNDCGRVAGHDDEPDAKRRIKERNVAYSTPPFKTVKEPKIVVQAAGDVGISGDGFRWRKYGQKMVKGSPNPRSYYKCTSAGCPVRKHVEGAANDTSTIIITYEGKHDHDMPVPKKRHGPPSAALLIAAAAAMNSAQLKKSEALANRKPSKGEVTGDKALELGGEKVLESARTLLSIGIELKPY